MPTLLGGSDIMGWASEPVTMSRRRLLIILFSIGLFLALMFLLIWMAAIIATNNQVPTAVTLSLISLVGASVVFRAGYEIQHVVRRRARRRRMRERSAGR